MKNSLNNRSALLIGEDKLEIFKSKTILICGLGGVGGTALESLVRSGFMNFIIVDKDEVDITNLNRQILYNEENIGLLKVKAAENHLKKINKELKVIALNQHVNEEFIERLSKYQIDFVIDAIDQSLAKFLLIRFCQKNQIPFVSSLGMANRLDPSQVKRGFLHEVQGDPLARKLKQYFKKESLSFTNIPVVYSIEKPIIKDRLLASMMNAPSSAGLVLSAICIESFLNEL